MLPSCATIKRNELDIPVYPATVADGFLIYMGSSNVIHGHGHVPWYQQLILRPALIIGGLIDLPISLVTDTVLLPYDLYTYSKNPDATEINPPAEPTENEPINSE